MRRLLFVLALSSGPALAEPQVVTDIAPVHSLVSAVMKGIGEPDLLLEATADPHHITLRPSQARALARSDAVFWIGPALTPWLENPVSALPEDARTVALMEVTGTHLIGADEGDDHGHGQFDPHAWLDPENAVVWLDAIARTLSDLDPTNSAIYSSNAEEAASELRALQTELAQDLASISDTRFLVAHDAFSYFTDRFDLGAILAVAENEAAAPSAGRLAELHEELEAAPVVCAFREPQQNPAVLDTLLQGSDTPIAVLDPLGSTLQPGITLYADLLRNIARTVKDCGAS